MGFGDRKKNAAASPIDIETRVIWLGLTPSEHEPARHCRWIAAWRRRVPCSRRSLCLQTSGAGACSAAARILGRRSRKRPDVKSQGTDASVQPPGIGRSGLRGREAWTPSVLPDFPSINRQSHERRQPCRFAEDIHRHRHRQAVRRARRGKKASTKAEAGSSAQAADRNRVRSGGDVTTTISTMPTRRAARTKRRSEQGQAKEAAAASSTGTGHPAPGVDHSGGASRRVPSRLHPSCRLPSDRLAPKALPGAGGKPGADPKQFPEPGVHQRLQQGRTDASPETGVAA